MGTIPGVFIIESLDFEDEQGPKEGEILANILEFSGVENRYCYIRSKAEFKHFIDVFESSQLRYLHLSCHGNKQSITTTLEPIDHNELGEILKDKLDSRRLFLSACSAVNDSLASVLFKSSGCNSIVGPNKAINTDEIAIFWASFYHLMFKNNPSAMKKKDLVIMLTRLTDLYEMDLIYYRKKSTKPFFTREDLSGKSKSGKRSDFDS